ncbi:MAG: S-layer homology domain-containing protein, partial [Eubacteriales bacterium]|nr:S-layer homology domain-containing protein [Eubacteriales bacterium]
LPVFRNIVIENITAHGGDYGIFLEAFDEVPITGLVLRNITIDGADQMMRCMNWEKPVVENVLINGKRFPRPVNVRILKIPRAGAQVTASADFCGGAGLCSFFWETSGADGHWNPAGEGENLLVPETAVRLRVTAKAADGEEERSRDYRVIDQEAGRADELAYVCGRLACRGLLCAGEAGLDEHPVTRQTLAEMLLPLAEDTRGVEAGTACTKNLCPASADANALEAVIKKGFLAPAAGGDSCPEGYVTRQEMATVAMQACGVNYRNASSTMPVCRDVEQVSNNYGTNVARALYFGFMELEPDQTFQPDRPVTGKEAARIINRVADFAGL